MTNVLTSASKIVFILMALATCAFTAMGIITGEQFMVLASMAFAFYFSNKGDTTQEYAGK